MKSIESFWLSWQETIISFRPNNRWLKSNFMGLEVSKTALYDFTGKNAESAWRKLTFTQSNQIYLKTWKKDTAGKPDGNRPIWIFRQLCIYWRGCFLCQYENNNNLVDGWYLCGDSFIKVSSKVSNHAHVVVWVNICIIIVDACGNGCGFLA